MTTPTVRLVRWWRGALHVRVAVITMLVSILSVGGLALFLGGEVSDRLFEAKTDSLLLDAGRTRAEAETALEGMDATDVTEVETFLRNLVAQLTGPTEGTNREVIMRRNANNSTELRLLDPVSTSIEHVSPELQDSLRSSTGQFYQPVQLGTNDDPLPGIVVGQQVAVPVAGPYDLYLIYNLKTEQQTLASVQRALVFGAIALVATLVVVSWIVTRFVVSPIREAARAANRLAQGELDERLPVRSSDELAILAQSFNGMADSLQQQIEAMRELSHLQRRFVSDVSHELRTPLTTIKMAAEVILDSSEDFEPGAKRSTELLVTQIERFEQLLADLLEISRFDAGAASLDTDDVDLVGITRGVVDMMQPLAQARDVPLSFDVTDDRIHADVDRLRFERVARNLVVNAIEHAEAKPVEVVLAHNESCVAVLVRDHGVGLADDDLPRVFDRFWRADPARARTTGGTGLGLSIAREDARLHGGYLEVWGEPQRGAAFRLTLPIAPGGVIDESAVPLPDRGFAVRKEAPAA